MILTIDTDRDSLVDVLRTVGAAFAVDLAPVGEPAPTKTRTKGRRGRGERSARGRQRDTAAAHGDPREIRRWALDNGYEVSSRGALPRNVVEAYSQASQD